MSQDLGMKITCLHKKGHSYKKISKALLISCKSSPNILKGWICGKLVQTARPSTEVDTSSRTFGGEKRRKPTRKHMNKKALLELSQLCVDKGEGYWDSILRNDKTKRNLFGSDGFQAAWRGKGEDYDEKFMVSTVKHGGGSVLV